MDRYSFKNNETVTTDSVRRRLKPVRLTEALKGDYLSREVSGKECKLSAVNEEQVH